MYAKVKEEVRSYCPSIYILAVGPLILDPSITNTSFVICWLITLCPSKNLYFILVKPFEINENIFFQILWPSYNFESCAAIFSSQKMPSYQIKRSVHREI